VDAPIGTTIDSAKKRMNLTPGQLLKKMDGLRSMTQNALMRYTVGTFGE
ncbi:MAG: hypothetical protein RL127_806, partial [Bacteroidota bacterium]